MKTKIRLIVLALSLSMLLMAMPAQSGPAKVQAGPVLTLQSPTLALTVTNVCSTLPRLQNFLKYLLAQPQTPLVVFLEKITQASIDYLVAHYGCTA